MVTFQGLSQSGHGKRGVFSRTIGHMSPRKQAMAAGATVLIGALAWGEWVSWRASRSFLGDRAVPARGGTDEAVVVFGFRNRNPRRLNALNRWRVHAALRSVTPEAETRLVLCGGDPSGIGISEAELLSRYAEQEGGWAGRTLLDTASDSTWANVVNAIPLVENADRIVFVSDPLHGMKARLYLWALRPDLAVRLVRASDYRLGEWTLLKPFAAIYGLRALSQAKHIAAHGGPV
jgi:uncharacterized SAM-binding protein YcdF (DUF218 family)